MKPFPPTSATGSIGKKGEKTAHCAGSSIFLFLNIKYAIVTCFSSHNGSGHPGSHIPQETSDAAAAEKKIPPAKQ